MTNEQIIEVLSLALHQMSERLESFEGKQRSATYPHYIREAFRKIDGENGDIRIYNVLRRIAQLNQPYLSGLPRKAHLTGSGLSEVV